MTMKMRCGMLLLAALAFGANSLAAEQRGKSLNNLVTEVVNLAALPSRAYQEVPFTNPRAGWIFVSSTAEVKGETDAAFLAVDGEKDSAVIFHRWGDPAVRETMRFLAAGEHKLRIWSEPGTDGALPTLRNLVVRAIPEIQYCAFPAKAHSGYGGYDMNFLARGILANVNTIVGSGNELWKSEQKAWKERGGKWLLEQNIPTLLNLPDMPKPFTAEYAYNWWTKSAGFQNPYLDGVVADEFGLGDDPSFNGYAAAVERIAKEERFKNRVVYAWVYGPVHQNTLSMKFSQAILAAGYKIAGEVYLREPPAEADAQKLIEGGLGPEMVNWNKAFPGFANSFIVVLGFLAAPPESLDVNPNVDFKVFLDMQFNCLANAPEWAGLYGVMVYKSTYADEETLRWAGRLFRHYCIEGNTDLLSARYGYTYRLDHIQNADFADGTKGWTISPAEEGSVKAMSHEGYSWLEGRYSRTPEGDTFLWMKRSATKPNSFRQEIGKLVPGRLYSMKMITSDYQELVSGKSTKALHAVSIRLKGAEMLSEPRTSLQAAVGSMHDLGQFRGRKNPLWLNYYDHVFRAQAEKATLEISDWADEKNPGGPAGQELMYNFIEVQPYFED
jgi:hypothetical protein